MPRFRVGSSGADQSERDTLYLNASNWDDWFKYETLFTLYYTDSRGNLIFIGGTKIGSFGLKPAGANAEPREGFRRPRPPRTFSVLPEEFFSLGQDPSYYELLQKIGTSFREDVLGALRDIAYDSHLLALASKEEVARVSLLREVPLTTVQDQFARIARGGVRLTPYNFQFRLGRTDHNHTPLTFKVEPDSKPPTNIHALIGRNGVGKSTLLNELAKTLVRRARNLSEGRPGSFGSGLIEVDTADLNLSNLVSVSFSAFDAFEPIQVPQDRTKGLTYHYIGLKKKDESLAPKDPAALSREMTLSARSCLQADRRPRWRRAIRLLESDPIFAEAGLAGLISEGSEDEILEAMPKLFRRLSSGHAIVLLTISRLVEAVVEKSLVLLDEPEAHLHPPLLSAFIRALSDLLADRNGVAILATHSPVVLQEVPASCVYRLQRRGELLNVERLELETFGENVGTLTYAVFGLEVTSTGFNKILTEAADKYDDYEEALRSLGGQLGAEGRAILRARIASKTIRHVDA